MPVGATFLVTVSRRKRPPDWPKCAPDWPKCTPDWPKCAPDWLKGAPDWPKCTPDWPKCAPDSASKHSLRVLHKSWAHLSAKYNELQNFLLYSPKQNRPKFVLFDWWKLIYLTVLLRKKWDLNDCFPGHAFRALRNWSPETKISLKKLCDHIFVNYI